MVNTNTDACHDYDQVGGKGVSTYNVLDCLFLLLFVLCSWDNYSTYTVLGNYYFMFGVLPKIVIYVHRLIISYVTLVHASSPTSP